MLDYLQRGDDVERLALRRDRLRRFIAIVDGQPHRLRMGPCDAKAFRRCVETGDGEAKTGQRLRRDAAAAADIGKG